MDIKIKIKLEKRDFLKKWLNHSLTFYSYIPYKTYSLLETSQIINNLKPDKKTTLLDCLKLLKWPESICSNLVRWSKELSYVIYKGFKTIDEAEIASLQLIVAFTTESNNEQSSSFREKLLTNVIKSNISSIEMTENNLIIFLYSIFKSIQGFICTNIIFFSVLPELELIDFTIKNNIFAILEKYILKEDCFEDTDGDEFYIYGYKELLEKKTGNKVFFLILRRFLEFFYNKKFPNNMEFDEGNLDEFLNSYRKNDNRIKLEEVNFSKFFKMIPEFCSPFNMIFTILTGESFEDSNDRELKDLIGRRSNFL